MTDFTDSAGDLSAKRRSLLELLLDEEKLADTTAKITRRLDGVPAPLSFAQERLWFLDQYYPGSPLYNIPSSYPLPGPLRIDAVRTALNGLVRRHEILRTTFSTRNGQPFEVVKPHLELDVPVVDLTGLPEGSRHAEASRLLGLEALHVFSLRDGPLIRARLLRLGEDLHVLSVVMHHIVSDAWSMEIFVREYNALYGAACEDRPSGLVELPIQYGDFANWQRQRVDSDAFRNQLSYWKDTLAGCSNSSTELPADRPRSSTLSFRGATVSFRFPLELSVGVRSLGRESGLTLFMTLLAGFKALLLRYSGRRSVVVGFPTAGRNRTELENLIGFFVNSLVLHTEVPDNASFRQHMARVKEVVVGALANQDVPFERLVEELHPLRTVNANPLFQVMFDFRNEPGTAVGSDSTCVPAGPAPIDDVLTAVSTGTSKFDMSLSMMSIGGRLCGTIEYSTDLFDHSTVVRLLGHLRTLLTSAVQRPDASIRSLDMLTSGERHQLLCEWNDTAAAFPDGCVHEQFESQAERSPDAVAAVCDGDQLTYGELNSVGNRLARFLREQGVGPETIVGICMEGSTNLIVSILAVLKAGAAFLPLDPAYPRERLAFMVNDAGVRLILAQEQLSQRVDGLASTVVTVEGASELSAGFCDDNLPNAGTSSNACYVIYTSGSTGKPKGVVVEHRSVVNLIHHLVKVFKIGPGSRVLQFSSISFDISIREIFESLFSGAAIYLRRRDAMAPGEALFDLLQRERITVATLVPSIWACLPDGELPDLSTLIAGGEPCPPQLVQRWAPGKRFFNAYGPTEITVASSVTLCRPTGEKPTIGRPLANTRYYVVDRHLQPCAIGQVGELLIGGAGLARGYLKRPGLTADRFIPDPFGEQPGGRLYRTGDLARLLPSGEVDCLGRADNQVKIHGFRIELGEIEAVLGEHPGVETAAINCLLDAQGEKRLTAYVVAKTRLVPPPEDLRLFLAARLPSYMIPQSFVVLPELPLTASGKLDYLALPAPETAALTRAYVSPRNPVETVLANVWQQVLSVEEVGVHDNFFELGGHSLLVTRVASRLRDTLGVEVPVRAFFEAPTVAELALHLVQDPEQASRVVATARVFARVSELGEDEIDELLHEKQTPTGVVQPEICTEVRSLSPSARDGAPTTEAPTVSSRALGIPRREQQAPVPLSFAQERLWFLEQFEPNTPRYNILTQIPLPGHIDAAILKRSINEIVRRHQVLRTVFPDEDGHPIQVVLPNLEVDLTEFDLSVLAEPERDVRAATTAYEEVTRCFDLARGPLLRPVLLRLGPGENLLILTMHHIVCDGWSLDIVRDELATFYEAYAADQRPSLPPLPVQYADYSVWQRERLQGTALHDQLSYWREHLTPAPPALELPFDRPRPRGEMLHSSIETFAWPQGLCRRLERLGREEGATTYMAVLAAFKALLFRYTGQTRIVVGSPVANRNRAELEPLIGFFSNTLALCSELGGSATFRDLLRRVREVALGAYAHQDVPFERIVEELQPERKLSINPIFQVMFVFQDGAGPLASLSENSLPASRGMGDHGTARFELMLYVERTDEQITGAFEYATELFDRATVHRMVRHLRILVEHLVSDPDQPLSCAPILNDEERHQLLIEYGGSGSQREVTHWAPVHQLVEQQVAKTPDAVAIVSDDGHWSYRDLDEQATRIANRLAEFGVGPEVCVAVSMPRGQQLLAVLLGVVKAGGTYLPLDPSFPTERLTFMLADAQVPVVVVSRGLEERLPKGELEVLFADELLNLNGAGEAPRKSVHVGPHSAAYVIYTSGSTGVPKGVVVSHRTLSAIVSHQCGDRRGPAPTTLQFSSPSFDVSLQEIFATWCVGGTLICAPQDSLRVPTELRRLLASKGVERLFLPFVALQQLAEAEGDHQLRLKEVITAGEQLKVTPPIRKFFSALQGCSLINQYGPAETHVVSEHRLSGDPAAWPTLPPIGRPAAGAKLYVLDQRLQPTPVGVIGHLYIGGFGLAGGYLDQPGLTADRFIPDPFSATVGDRMYRTGDLVRYRADGRLEFVGRTDLQVKVRGFRVELGEIEVHLTDYPAVRDAAVVAHRSNSGDIELRAYVVPGPGETPTLPDLRDFLRARVPFYMVPGRLTVVSALPMTATGKIDRARLPDDADRSRPEVRQPFVAARSPLEERITEVWKEVLGLDQIGVQDDFFELGGHSLLAAQIISRLRSRLEVEIQLRTLFEESTIARLAVEIVQLQANSADDVRIAELLGAIEDLSDPEADGLIAQAESRSVAILREEHPQ